MTASLFSPLWYRVAELRPALRPHTQIHRHVYRGQPWYVLQDHANGRVHRFSAGAYRLVGLMDGKRTVQQIWDSCDDALGGDLPSQQEIIDLLAKLHAADALQTDIPPDTRELFKRQRRLLKQQQKQSWWNPFAVRFPLYDPDRLLEKILPIVRPAFGKTGLTVWFALVASALVLAGMHWESLSGDLTDRILSPGNLLLIALSYPFIKALHELGHGLATKHFGGEVHETGIMLLALLPAPYVNATASAAFPRARQRILVSAAGIMVEAALASLALFLWLAVEPGTLRALAYNVMLVAGFSTLFINGNPLLRFDGYYVFADTVGIPNLAPRANRYIGYLVQRYLFGLEDVPSPADQPSERPWLAAYALLSFAYRLVVLAAIALVVASEYAWLGVLLAVWASITQLVLPAFKLLQFVFSNPRLQTRRGRAIVTTILPLTALTATLLFAPAPLYTGATGVIWLPEQAEIRTGTEGILLELLAEPNAEVRKGDALARLDNPYLATNVATLAASLRSLEAEYTSVRITEPVRAQMIDDEMQSVRADLDRARQELDRLIVRSPGNGRFMVDRPQDLPGRWLNKGDPLAYVIDPAVTIAKVVVPQEHIGLIRERIQAVEARLASNPAEDLTAHIRRIVPSASERLPSPALGSRGGGPFAVDPSDEQGTLTLETLFQLELELPIPPQYLGSRVHVRFDHGHEPLAQQWYRRLSQLFLRHIDV